MTMTTPVTVTASRLNCSSTINPSCCRASPGRAGGKLLTARRRLPDREEQMQVGARPPLQLAARCSLRARASHMVRCVIASAPRCTSAEQRTRGACGPATQRPRRCLHNTYSLHTTRYSYAPCAPCASTWADCRPSPALDARASQHLGVSPPLPVVHLTASCGDPSRELLFMHRQGQPD